MMNQEVLLLGLNTLGLSWVFGAGIMPADIFEARAKSAQFYKWRSNAVWK